jgi:AraC family transcriptional regulator
VTGDVFSLVKAGCTPITKVPSARGLLLHIYLPVSIMADPAGRSIALKDGAHGEDRGLRFLSRRLWAEMICDDPAVGLALDAGVLAIAASLARSWSANGAPPAAWQLGSRCDRRLLRVMERLAADLTETPRLAELADQEGISQRHLCTLFKRATGRSPHQWLTDRRVERARDLLRDTSVSVTDVALSCGFSSSQYFCSVFRERVGTTPSTFRLAIA